MDQFWIREVDRANKQVGGSERSKNYIYEQAGIQTTAYGHTCLLYTSPSPRD